MKEEARRRNAMPEAAETAITPNRSFMFIYSCFVLSCLFIAFPYPCSCSAFSFCPFFTHSYCLPVGIGRSYFIFFSCIFLPLLLLLHHHRHSSSLLPEGENVRLELGCLTPTHILFLPSLTHSLSQTHTHTRNITNITASRQKWKYFLLSS